MGQRKINGVDGEHRYFDLKVEYETKLTVRKWLNYDCLLCRCVQIIFEPYRTGFEEEKNFIPEQGQIIAGRYRVVELLGQVRDEWIILFI